LELYVRIEVADDQYSIMLGQALELLGRCRARGDRNLQCQPHKDDKKRSFSLFQLHGSLRIS